MAGRHSRRSNHRQVRVGGQAFRFRDLPEPCPSGKAKVVTVQQRKNGTRRGQTKSCPENDQPADYAKVSLVGTSPSLQLQHTDMCRVSVHHVHALT